MAARDISFASFNLLNLQRPGAPMYSGSAWSEDQYEAKLFYTGAVLSRLAPDVTGFQELWDGAALTEALDIAGMAESHVALVPPDHGGDRIACAGAVRADMLVGEPEWIVAFPAGMALASGGDDPQQDRIAVELGSFSRPVLHVTVRPHEETPVIHVFVCHFKSRRPTELWREGWYDRETHAPHLTALGYAISTIRRTAEAAALRMILTDLMKGSNTPVVVIGDMNDGKLSNTLNILTEQPQYLTGLSEGGGDNALYTAQVLQEYRSTRDVYYTHVYRKERESLDHILVSQEFYDHSRRRLWAFDEMVVENDHLNRNDHDSSGTSDHGVIRAGFRWRPAEGASV
ncbi:endonuclease/exonuclease/phosphatase family protein [Celeribacter indicus]|uniref:Extracellular nuclease n=1 Tax=Celeribacter indicus TaxID=1208324 RepID=A0A0B5E7V2_9RHOB|nr:endonuclease/exonuclease/phosphatase family protein [Celeribacter indicus]AJE48377.1 extracellular nuclease [Celeribacter indicus]SDW74317.1 Endonuclease/Exonuclease/phosphatase family protein [Celeribacter indicus]